MTAAKSIKIAILTDIHAFTKDDGPDPSWINLADDQGNPKVNPFAGLHALISGDEAIRADLVVCCGDMGDRASPEGQQYVWGEVNRLRAALHAERVAATAGNHDMDSRLVNTKFDAKGQLQALVPPFPIADRDNWLEYWATNFTQFEHGTVRFVLLNTAAYHGYHDPKATPEYLHGRVSDRTLDAMAAALKLQGKRPANVLICHHHPLKNDEIKIDDYSEMRNGDRLLNELVNARVGPWLIIHGHKHLPRIIYAPPGNTAPTIFSAGSFSAKLPAEFGDRARNEFYILELEVPTTIGAVSSLKGSISSWQWSYGIGWQASRAGHGLGPGAAFGARVDVAEEAAQVATSLKAHNAGTSVQWTEVCQTNTTLKYLIPGDREEFFEHLSNMHGISPLHGPNGEVLELQVPSND